MRQKAGIFFYGKKGETRDHWKSRDRRVARAFERTKFDDLTETGVGQSRSIIASFDFLLSQSTATRIITSEYNLGTVVSIS